MLKLNPGPTGKTSHISESALEAMKNDILQEFRAMKNELMRDMRDIKTQTRKLSSTVDDIKRNIQDIQGEQSVLRLDIEAVSDRLDKLECNPPRQSGSGQHDVIDLLKEVEKLEQYNRRNNVLLYGVSEKPEEVSWDLRALSCEILNDCLDSDSVRLSPEDIAEAHRIGRRPSQTKPCSFQSRDPATDDSVEVARAKRVTDRYVWDLKYLQQFRENLLLPAVVDIFEKCILPVDEIDKVVTQFTAVICEAAGSMKRHKKTRFVHSEPWFDAEYSPISQEEVFTAIEGLKCGKSSGNKLLHEVVTVQGLPQICDANSNTTRRVVWFLIFCGGLCFTTFNIYNQISLYLSVPVNVRVDQILENTLSFPAITICNNNIVRRSLLENLGWRDVLQVAFPYTDFNEQLPNVNISQLDISKITSLQVSLTSSYGHTMENSTIKCDWESAPCGQDDFIYLDTDMGKCFTYNANGHLLARNSGRAHGLRLLLNAQEEEYTRSHEGYLGTGFMVAVHAPEVIPIMSEMGMAVAPGSQHFVGIGVKKVKAHEGVGDCGDRVLKHFTGNYSRHACKQDCEVDFIVSMCNCRAYANQSVDVTVCTAQQFQECYIPAKARYLQTDTGCKAGCPEPCSYTRFTTQHSSAPLTRNYITAYTKAKGQTEEYWRRNLVILEMYMSSMTYEHIEKQLEYGVLDLFCDIGGALGLLLGASLLTVLEVFDFLCITFVSMVFEKNKVGKLDSRDNSK
ncbi:acid-sensing ion channel 1A-like [Haliotis asinina]|uniref:acid-sensing ion channel 1A-like n=1 Tax=Haliotis asinina TaxID=109174 RepID=UPI003532615F